MNKSDGEQASDELLAEQLNTSAYLAMSRVEANVVQHLVALLRSHVPIDPMMRNAMADAFEGKKVNDRVTFRVIDQKVGPLSDSADRRYRFFRDMAISRFIAERRAAPHLLSLELAAEAAAEAFPHVGVKTCLAAVDKGRKMKAWMDKHYPDRPIIHSLVSDEQYRHFLEAEYFNLHDEGRLDVGNRFT